MPSVAISVDEAMHVCMLSHVWLFVTPWTVAHKVLLFSRQEYWSGLPFPPLGDLSNSGIEPISLGSPALAGRFIMTGAIWESLNVAEWTRNLLRAYFRVHLIPVSTKAIAFLFISRGPVNSELNMGPLISPCGPNLQVILACILYLGHERHLPWTGLYVWNLCCSRQGTRGGRNESESFFRFDGFPLTNQHSTGLLNYLFRGPGSE